MPTSAPRPCTKPGCGELAQDGTSRCQSHKQVFNPQRPSSTARGYGSKWQKARKEYLEQNYLCVECKVQGKINLATVVDHKEPHKGDPKIFWDRKNWQSLCKHHHDRKTAKHDGGFGNR